MKKILFVLFVLFFLGCHDRVFHDEPFLVISKPLESSQSGYKFYYEIRSLHVDSYQMATRTYEVFGLYSNDTLNVGATLYLKPEIVVSPFPLH